jgi:hypothetical protein
LDWQAAREGLGADGPKPNDEPAVQALEEAKLHSDTAEIHRKEHGDNPRERLLDTATTEPVSGLLVPPPEDTRSFSPSEHVPLPQEIAASTPAQPTHSASGSAVTTPKSILIVDDNAINLKVRMQLRKHLPIPSLTFVFQKT